MRAKTWITPKCFLTNSLHCNDKITVNCDKNILSLNGDLIFYYLFEFRGESGNIPVFLYFNQHVIVTM